MEKKLYQLRVFTGTYEKIRLFTSMEEARKEADRTMDIGEIAEKRVTGTIQTLILCGKEYRHANEEIITFRNALSRNSVNNIGDYIQLYTKMKVIHIHTINPYRASPIPSTGCFKTKITGFFCNNNVFDFTYPTFSG